MTVLVRHSSLVVLSNRGGTIATERSATFGLARIQTTISIHASAHSTTAALILLKNATVTQWPLFKSTTTVRLTF
jgi:hypothetical protein